MRELMLASQPDARFPMEVRTVAADDAFLSSQHGTATTVTVHQDDDQGNVTWTPVG